MIKRIKRDYFVKVLDPATNDCIFYCRSNTFRGVVEYLFENHVLQRFLKDMCLIVEFHRIHYDD